MSVQSQSMLSWSFMLTGWTGQERGLFTGDNNGTEYSPEVSALLETISALNKVSIRHCPGHQKGSFLLAKGIRQLIKLPRLQQNSYC